MHTKWVLLAIVLLNIVDCVLVMGELILDIYYLKGSFKHFSCFIEIWIAFFCGLGFQGNVIIDGKNNYYELQNEMYKISFNA